MVIAEWSLFEALNRNWAMAAMISTVATLTVVPALILLKYVRIALNIMRTTKPPLSRAPLDFDRLHGEPCTFPAFDGQRLNAMLTRAPPDAPRRGLIIFAHEYCSDLFSAARYCRALVDAGYDLLSFDFRGHGLSDAGPEYTPRQWLTHHEVDDIRGAIAFAEHWLEQQDRPRRVGVFGVSRGACAAIAAAQENENITAIAVDGVFSTDSTIEHFMQRWAYIFARVYPPADHSAAIFWRFLRWCMICYAAREFGCRFPSVRKALVRMTPRPILFIHGEKDSYLPVDQSRRLYALASQPKQLWVVPGARHNQAAVLHPDEYARITVSFFNRYLDDGAQSADLHSPPAAEAGARAAGAQRPSAASNALTPH